ncbi:MAG: KilA-N domain-containing protein [Pseudomonadales bacterium]|nr:KilA-N domain-containing protein [Pseudomonadales bacterium]
MATIDVKGTEISVYSHGDMDFISLTDMLRAKDGDFFIADWLRNRNTVEFLGIWEQVHNPAFNYGGFATIRSQAGLNNYKLSVKEWVAQTHAIKANLIPPALTSRQTSQVYASEADLLNMALFGKTAKQWRDENPERKGNIRDDANVSQLVCLANLETLNAHFIHQGLPQAERLKTLNQTAIQQMQLLLEDRAIRQWENPQ